MCGIIGYTGGKSAAPILLEGLTNLEYRGYDSAGIAVLDKRGAPRLYKSAGKLSRLKRMLSGEMPEGSIGVGHTRWATHGGPTDFNAHPHTDCSGDVIVVHNGIFENYLDIKRELAAQGHEFDSQTDAECIPHLIEAYLNDGASLEDAARAAALRMQGASAVVALSRREPNKLIAFKIGNAGGIVIGRGDGETLLASDMSALQPYAQKVAHLDVGEMAVVTADGAAYQRLDGGRMPAKPAADMPRDAYTAAKGKHKHFMLKEIHDQPEAVMDALRGRLSLDPPGVQMPELPFSDAELRRFNRVIFIGMGTSLHAGMVGRLWMESLAGIPAEADNSSEFRYREPVMDDRALVVSISQSGETADTLAAMDEARRRGAKQITLCNHEGAQATRVADAALPVRAGLEIGVAATKTFVCSLATLYALAAYIAAKRGVLSARRLDAVARDLAQLPHMIAALIADQSQYESLAREYARRSDFLFLGRGKNYPMAMEGALKLKEISYIHAEGYPAGEMKHGPISLIDENMPVVAIAPQDGLRDKMLSSIHEVKARGGSVIAIATEGDAAVAESADRAVFIPKASDDISPILAAVPMQLLAYHIALRRGCDVDQPRNLAKSVTVE